MAEVRFGSHWNWCVGEVFDEGAHIWGVARALRYNDLITSAIEKLQERAPCGIHMLRHWGRDVWAYHLALPNQFLDAFSRIGDPAHSIIYRWIAPEDAVELIWLLRDGQQPWNVPR